MAELGVRRTAVRGIGVSGQQHGLVPLDAAGKVVRPAKLWCDTATAPQCETITQHFGGEAKVIELVGNAMLPGYTAPKILWLRENEPENWARTKTLLLPHDYLNFWLTGEVRMEYGDASGTALLDVKSRKWAQPVVDFLECGDKLPALGSSAEAAGTLRDELRQRWGLQADVVVSAGGGDNMMAAIGTGNTSSGVVTASLGTSGTLFAFSEHPVIDDRGEIAAFCDSTDHWMPLLCTMNVTLVTELVRELFSWNHAALDAQVSEIPAGAGGLTLLPYLTGERTPNLPHGCGVLHGLTTENFTAAHLARAAMEGVTMNMNYGLRRLAALGAKAKKRGVLRFNQYDQVIHAALAGQGVALGRLPLLQPLLDEGRLVVVEPARVETDYAYWLLHADAAPRRAVRLVADWIRAEAQAGAAS